MAIGLYKLFLLDVLVYLIVPSKYSDINLNQKIQYNEDLFHDTHRLQPQLKMVFKSFRSKDEKNYRF